MKLLFLTQVLDENDAILGFVSRWVEGLARHAEFVRVVALEVGATSGLPPNVDHVEIGRKGRVARYLRYRRALNRALFDEGFDAVLAHMVPRYALVAERPARRAGAGLFLWYTHKGVDARLRRAVPRCDLVFTASAESLRLESSNKVVTGHGIDLAHFPLAPEPRGRPRIVSVGRMTPAKDPLTILEAVHRLVEQGRDVELELVGGGLAPGDGEYADLVRGRVDELGLFERVQLRGAMPYPIIPEEYAEASVVVNASHTGSVDKVVLEAFATGRPVVSCNESIAPLVAELGEDAASLGFAPGDADDLARKIAAILDRSESERAQLGRRLRAIVERDHEVDRLMERLVTRMASHGAAAGGPA